MYTRLLDRASVFTRMASQLFSGVTKLVKGKKGSREEVALSSVEGEGKVLGLYFSAHWCPPCRGFTPQLAKWYTGLKDGALSDKFEIVFISSDRDEDSFDEYFDSMPWLALPYQERELKAQLSKKFKVSGIPTFLIFDGQTGELTNKNGRDLVSSDPKGEEFPWRAETALEILRGDLISKDKVKKSFDDIKGKPFGIYFSAHWCPPCRAFTPNLAKFYTSLKGTGKDIEIIFVSGDNNEDEFEEYLSEMPWVAIPYGEKSRREKLNSVFEVSGIPHLVILDGDGKVITDNARGMVDRDPEGKEFPWFPKPLEALHSGTVDAVNNRVSIICFTDGSPEQIEKAKTAITPVATPYFEQHKVDRDNSVCFLYTEGDNLAERLQKFINVTPPFPQLVLINMSAQQKCFCDSNELNEQVVRDFLKQFEEKTLTYKGLRD